MHKLAIITAVAPDRADHLHETAQSVAQTRNHLNIQWIVVWDGVSTQPVEHADAQLTTGKLCSGASVSRNTALPTVEAEYLLKLDADDVLNPEGVAATIHQLEKNPDAGWAAANMLIHGTGERTEHWANTPETYPEGTLAGLWTVPFPLHPGAVIYRTDRVLQAAGWPALNSAENLGLLLHVAEDTQGLRVPDVLVYHRQWDAQESQQEYAPQREEQALKTIRATINARRGRTGREPVYFRTR